MVVGKKCADNRGLNIVTIKKKYPLPCIEDLFDQLNGVPPRLISSQGIIKFVCGNRILRRPHSPPSMGIMNKKLYLLD
jgi:hypothetical protein